MGNLKGHIALVTGGTRGIGKSIALRLARDGASTAIVGISEHRGGDEVVKLIEEMGTKAVRVRADVSERGQVHRMFSTIKEGLGPVDILVNCAAISDTNYTSAWDLGDEVWERMYRINLKGVYLCCAEALPDMISSGWGRIINISSTSGISGGTSGVHYAATKGGVNALSKALAHEVAHLGITVNVVAPSKIDTDMFRNTVKPEDRQKVIDRIPVGRIGRPEEIAEAVAYFASEEAGYTTGQILVASGGY
jgi:NAD(P)-dependent dehydrogenase (short-subunit alcohol dehydrogenase family)